MRTAIYGRAFFGLSAVFFGVICLLWHDPGAWQSLIRIWSWPRGGTIAPALAIAQIVGGILVLFPRSARCGAITLLSVYAIFAICCLQGVVLAPRSFGEYDGVFEKVALMSGALAIFALTETTARGKRQVATVARMALGICTLIFGIAQIVFFKGTASLVPAWIPPNAQFWTVLTTGAFGLAAVAMLLTRYTRIASGLLALMLLGFGLLVWVPLLVAHPSQHFSWSEFALTLLIAGAAWTIADAATIGSSRRL